METGRRYDLIKSKKRKKTISLRVRMDGRIVIYAPHRMPQEAIEKFFEEKRGWIHKKLQQREETQQTLKPREFISGERFPFLGDGFPLEVQENRDRKHPLVFSQNRFILDQGAHHRARDLFVRWYRKEARERIEERVEHFSQRLQLFHQGIRITGARYRWGSCSAGNRLSFSWRIIMAPLHIIDYVILHELVHVKEKNHSKRFWEFLEMILPDCREHRRWLRESGPGLDL